MWGLSTERDGSAVYSSANQNAHLVVHWRHIFARHISCAMRAIAHIPPPPSPHAIS
jgi:hypothetical protein